MSEYKEWFVVVLSYKRNPTMANPELIRQIEYYLSEDNLQIDEFFYKEVAADPYISFYLVSTSSRSTPSSSATRSRSWASLISSKSLRQLRSAILWS